MLRFSPFVFAFVIGALLTPNAVAAPPDSFGPALQTGGWAHVVPLELPPAPAGLTPELALAFDFRVADGVLGPQWTLVGPSRIERHGNWGQGAPEAGSMVVDDTFALDGQVLYLEGALYHTEQDDERYFTYVAGLDQWTATRDGWTWVYGGLDEGDNGCAVEGTETYDWTCENRIGTPTFDETSAWLLASVTDSWGNTIEYTYTSNDTLDLDPGQLEGDYAYRHVLSQIVYANGHHVVDFTYHGRADAPVTGNGARLWLTTGRLEEITVTSGTSTIASRYAMVYQDEAATACDVEAERSSWSADVGAVGTGESLLQRIVRMENDAVSLGGKSLRCMTQADDADAWPQGDATPLMFSTDTALNSVGGFTTIGPSGTAFEFARDFSDPAFYSHQVVNFDGGPEAELLELQFPVCDLEVSEYALRGFVDDQGRLGQTGVGYRLEGCDSVEVVANLWSVDAAQGRLSGGTSPVLEAAFAEIDLASPASDPVAFVFLDIDRDGRTDSITARDGLPAVVHRDESGSAHSAFDIYLNGTYEDAELLSSAVFTDIDGDGLIDIVWREGADAFWLPNQGRSPYWDDASSALTMALPFTPSDDQPLQGGVMWADVNQDGVTDLTIANDGVVDPDDPTAILTDTDLSTVAGVYYGVGDGTFRFAFDPGYASLSEGYWVPWAGELSGTTFDPAQLWAGTLPWTYADVDRDGELEPVSAASLGLPYEELSYLGACSNFMAEGETCNDGYTPGYQQLLADWTGDGFIDVLYIETPAFKVASSMGDDYLVYTGGTGNAILYPGTRTLAEERVTTIETAWGGDVQLTYGLSSDDDRNAELPWAVDVIRSVIDESGTTEFAFEGGVWWPELGRFMGFRDALVTRENGGMTHVRYAPVPWAGGREVYRSDRRSDGSIEFFAYNSARDPATGQTTLDLDAPFFNPVRARCEAWLGFADVSGDQSVNEGMLIDECECSMGSSTVTPPDDQPGGGCPNDPGPGGGTFEPGGDTGLPPLDTGVTEGEFVPECPPPPPPSGPEAPPPVTAESTCEHIGPSVMFNVYGWSGGSAWYDEEALNDGNVWSVDSAAVWNVQGGSGVSPSAWYPFASEAAAIVASRPPYAVTNSDVPAGLVEPGSTPPERRTVGTTAYVMTAQGWVFNAVHRLIEHRDRGQTDLTGDERTSQYNWGVWSGTLHGAQLLERETWTGPSAAADLLMEAFTYGTRWTEVTDTTETRSGIDWAMAQSRSWSTAWSSQGERQQETDADGVVVDYTRNACGQALTRDVGVRATESFTYDDACRKQTWSFLSGSASWAYDDFGRVTGSTMDPGGPSATVVESTTRAGNSVSVETGNGADGVVSLRTTTLDAWGREQVSTACESDGAAAPECVANTASRVQRGWAEDGSLRFVTLPFDPDSADPATLTAVWTYRDEFGRAESTWTPAPVASQEYVLTEQTWLPGESWVTDPANVTCVTEFSSLETARSCAGTTRGSETRDAWGRTERAVGPDGVAVDFTYDAFDRLSSRALDGSIVFADGTVTPETTYAWTDAGRLDEQLDNAGVVTTYGYDSVGRQTSVTVDGPTSAPVTVSASGYVDLSVSGTFVTVGQHTDLDGNTSWTLADARGRTFSLTAADGSTAWSEFDSRGLLADATNVDSITTAFTYDGLGRLIEETREGLTTSPSFVYDAAGRALSVTDRDGVTTETVYARSGQPLAVYRERTSAADWTLASYTYDDDGLVASAVSLGVESTLEYDALRRVQTVCEAPSGASCERETVFAYDNADRVTGTEVTAGGTTVTTTTEYDDLGNVTRVIYPDATDATWTYYRSGQVATATDEGGLTTEWGYDDLGRLLIEDRPRQLARMWSYTNGVSTPDGLYGTQVERDEPDGGLFTVQRDFAGRAVYAENPYGDAETWSYVGSQLRHRESASGGTALAHQTWGYDAAGRMGEEPVVRFAPRVPTREVAFRDARRDEVPGPTDGGDAFAPA